VAIEGKHLPTEVGFDAEQQSGRDAGEDNEARKLVALRRFLTVYAEILWLCKTHSFIICPGGW
jgi:hypothetical protein